jgi:hypothetical protein
MQLHERAGNGEPEAGAALALGILALHLFERLADLVKRLGGNADAGVCDGEDHRGLMHMGAQRDAAAIAGEFYGVGEQVEHDLLHGAAVALHGQPSANLLLHGDVLLFGLNGGQPQGFLDQRREIDGLAVDAHMARLDLRHVENIVDDVEQVFAAIVNIAGIFGIFRRADRSEHLILQDIGKAEDGVERRAQLMAHIGEEFGFRPVGGLRTLFFGEIIGVGVGKLGLLPLQLVLRGGEVADGGHQPAFGIAQPFLMTLQKGDIGADRDEAAIAGAALVDLQPAVIGKLHFGGARQA